MTYIKTSNGKMKIHNVKPIKMEEKMSGEEPQYPMLHLSMKDLPEMKNWKIGGSYEVAMELEQDSISKDGGSFLIKKIKV